MPSREAWVERLRGALERGRGAQALTVKFAELFH